MTLCAPTSDPTGAARSRALGAIVASGIAMLMLVPSVVGLAAVATVLSGTGSLGTHPAPAVTGGNDSFVTRSGSSLLVDGAPFRFVGFNLYDAAASDAYSCRPDDGFDEAHLDAAMQQVREAGGTVVRFWAFQPYTRGATDYSDIDRVLAAARAHGLRVLPVLENQWVGCSRPGGLPLDAVQDGRWFEHGYRSALAPQVLSFRDYASRITHHYRNDPTILAWSLMNEAETQRRIPDGRSVLVDFAADMSTVVHAADPHHLLTLGTQSNGAPGASGADFHDVYALSGLDFAEVHDWADRGSDRAAMPGAPSSSRLPSTDRCQDPAASLACSFAIARQLGKPIVVGEAGIAANDRPGRVARARQLGAKIDAAFAGGASGYLVWQLNRTNTDTYGVLVGSEDPLYAVLRRAHGRFSGR